MLRKEFMNMVECLKSDSNEAIKLAKQLANIPAVEVNSIKVWTAPTEESTGPSSSIEFMGTHAKFRWHDHAIEIDENLNGKLIVKYDSKVIIYNYENQQYTWGIKLFEDAENSIEI